MDFFVVLERPGFYVSRRRKCQKKVGKSHKLTKTDAMKWFQQKIRLQVFYAKQGTKKSGHVQMEIAQKSQKSIIIVFSRERRMSSVEYFL